MTDEKPPKRPDYDPQVLLNAQPVIMTVIDPGTFKVQFQNQTAHDKFGDMTAQTCYEKIVGGAEPCAFCRMPEAVQTGQITSSEVPLPNDEYLLIQWSKAETADGRTHIVESITNITDTKRQQKRIETLNQELQESVRLLEERSIRDGLTGLYNHVSELKSQAPGAAPGSAAPAARDVSIQKAAEWASQFPDSGRFWRTRPSEAATRTAWKPWWSARRSRRSTSARSASCWRNISLRKARPKSNRASLFPRLVST